MNTFIPVASGRCSAKQNNVLKCYQVEHIKKLDYKQNIQAINQFLNIYDSKANYKEHFKCTRSMKIARPVAVQLQVGVKNQIKVEWTHAFNHFPRLMYSFRKPHTTPRTIPDWSAKLLYLQSLLRTSCCRTATMLFWTSMIKTLFFASS